MMHFRPDEYPDPLCARCQSEYVVHPATLCWRCRTELDASGQDMAWGYPEVEDWLDEPPIDPEDTADIRMLFDEDEEE